MTEKEFQNLSVGDVVTVPGIGGHWKLLSMACSTQDDSHEAVFECVKTGNDYSYEPGHKTTWAIDESATLISKDSEETGLMGKSSFQRLEAKLENIELLLKKLIDKKPKKR